VRQRAENLWLHYPEAKELLSREPLTTFMEPIPSATLKPASTLAEAVATLNESSDGLLFILDDEGQLWGVSSGSDLAVAAQIVAYQQGNDQQDITKLQLHECISKGSVTVSADDSSLAVVSAMLENGLSWIPVVVSKSDAKLRGYVSVDKMTYWILNQLGKQIAARAQATA